ncbi:MAG: hypothetical protein QOK20_3598 [Acidimicrobiaceae bacterium]|nr:hypothetical protein [Acidimicrobiaceae bacterium]
MTRSVWTLSRLASSIAVAVVLMAGGCGGVSKQQHDAVAAARIRAAQARAIAQQARLGPAVQEFLAKAAAASSVTYTVVYDQGNGQTTSVFARAPDRRIDVVGASGAGSTDRVIIRGSDTVVCHLNADRWACVSGVESAPGGPFTPDAITQTIGSLVQLSQTYDFTVSQRRMLGLDASCLAAARRAAAAADPTVGDHALICVAPSGVILRVEDSGNPVQATSYRESVPSGAFQLPARPTPAVTSTSTSPAPQP